MWYGASKTDHRVVALYARHYSSAKSGKSVRDWLRHGITPPGESIVLLTPEAGALFVWLKNIRDDEQDGVNCSIFRNEIPEKYLSSDLILQAEPFAWNEWPGERLFTYVDPRAVGGDGLCFKRAGWRKCGKSKSGLIVLEKMEDWI